MNSPEDVVMITENSAAINLHVFTELHDATGNKW
jgi:hypothetical protein